MSPPSQKTIPTRRKLGALLSSEPPIQDKEYHDDFTDYLLPSNRRNSTDTSSSYPSTPSYNTTNSSPTSVTSSPYTSSMSSPWTEPSPYRKSPWIHNLPIPETLNSSKHGLIGSILREEGHIYSLVSSGDLLYTGSESKNVRVWKGLDDFSGFKSSSGLVKAIVVFGEKVFTGHQDGKIRVWRFLKGRRNVFRRVGNLPTTRDLLMKSVNPRNYVRVRRNRNVPWVKHYDAVSCMCVDVNQGLLYSGSWDKTLKVWRISDYKCLESVHAHEDALNAIAIGFDGFLFTGSADGTVKAWRRELVGRYTKHVLVETLLEQDHAMTSLAVNQDAGAVYAGSSDGLVNFWEREKHFMTYGGVLRGHKLAVLCLAVAGSLVVSGSTDKSICVWRRDRGGMHVCTTVLNGHMGPVKCLTVAKEDEENGGANDNEDDQKWILYSGSLDKSVKVWRVTEPRIAYNGDGRDSL